MSNRVLFIVANVCSSFSSLFIVLFIIKEVSQLSGKENLFQALGMAFYLGGMAMGSFLNKNIESSYLKLFGLELGNFVIGSLSIFLMYLHLGLFTALRFDAPTTPQDMYSLPLYLWGLGSVVFIGIFTGAELPEFLKFTKIEKGKVLFFNYLGALFSGFFLNSLLTHSFTTIQILIVFTILCGLTQFVLLLLSKQPIGILLFGLIPSIGFAIIPAYHFVEKTFLASYYFGVKAKNLDEFSKIAHISNKIGKIENIKTPYQDLHLVTEYPPKKSNSKGNISLFLNYRPQFDLYSSRTYHESMYLGAMNLAKTKPKKVLILGGGDGILLATIRRFGFNGEITLVELDPKMIELFSTRQNLLHFNKGSLRSESFNLVLDDGFQFLKETSLRYDAVFIDFPYPYSDQLTGLYSEEFYTILKAKLAPNGFAIIDFPLTSGGALSPLYSKLELTLKGSGFNTRFPFGPYSGFVFIQEEFRELDFNYDKLPKGLHLSTELNLYGLNYLKRPRIEDEPFSLFYEN
ncbi:MAG: hypothetical protein NXH75_07545 [Halobacteriovoraceae bacterium]|nr:hypothetical protein [Halobacteriovoraceae bacterium]